MISITVKEYKFNIEPFHIKVRKEVSDDCVGNIDVLKGKASEDHRTILVYDENAEISENDKKNFSKINSIFDEIFLTRVKNTFFIFGNRDIEEIMEFFEREISKSLMAVQYFKIERLEKIKKEYDILVEDVHKEKEKTAMGKIPNLKPIDDLSRKNEGILPIFKQSEKQLERIKAHAKNENYHGVFNSLLREIEEDKVYGLRTNIKTSSNAANLLLQHHTMLELVSLEKAIEGLYLFIGTYYITHLILLLIESYYGIEHYNQFWTLLSIIIVAFLLTYISMKVLKKKK